MKNKKWNLRQVTMFAILNKL